LGVSHRVLDAFVAQYPHNVEDVFGAVIFHGGFPVAHRVEGYFFQSWVFAACGCDFSAALEEPGCCI